MDYLLVDPPLRGEWKALHNPGDHPEALDFIGMADGNRLPYERRALLPHLFWKIAAADTYAWGRTVHAPISGIVVEAEDGYPDRERLNLPLDLARNFVQLRESTDDIQHFAGNYVVIKSSRGVAFVAHLQCDSITVMSGTEVTSGQRLGKVGNSGASILPHLHFHAMREWSSDVSEMPEMIVPFRFRTFERSIDGNWKSVDGSGPESGDRLRFGE